MIVYKFQSHYSIGEEVYHITPDSPTGVVIDINYNVSTNTTTYIVSFGLDTVGEYSSVELTNQKRF